MLLFAGHALFAGPPKSLFLDMFVLYVRQVLFQKSSENGVKQSVGGVGQRIGCTTQGCLSLVKDMGQYFRGPCVSRLLYSGSFHFFIWTSDLGISCLIYVHFVPWPPLSVLLCTRICWCSYENQLRQLLSRARVHLGTNHELLGLAKPLVFFCNLHLVKVLKFTPHNGSSPSVN